MNVVLTRGTENLNLMYVYGVLISP